MDVTTTDGTTLFAQAAGDGETVTFVGDAGYGAWQWGWQHAALTGPFETLVYDHRGVGRSEKPPGPYSVEQLADDLEAVLSAHGARKTHLVGAGLGGMVALDYARRYARARTLTLLGTAARGRASTRRRSRQTRQTRRRFAPRSTTRCPPTSSERTMKW
ncbi:alpha/beta fold hydrolase [Haladaptatus sp. GCM10025893]|uniref:alpha/beta fold hydrolase n=1 Tax=Haladaptatus sp. GCM10025893 TaxID=3252659 RepID=UPI003619F459